ncbi:hypothetical protein ACHWQZ_G006253 [Mnemiopsis leidyi]
MELNEKSSCNKIPKIKQDFSGNLEAKYWLKAQLGIKNNERTSTVYKVSHVKRNDPGENMLPRDHCDILLCLFTFDHVAVHPFTLTVTLEKISRALKVGGTLVTMYFDSKKLVQIAEHSCVVSLEFDEKSCLVDKFDSPSSSKESMPPLPRADLGKDNQASETALSNKEVTAPVKPLTAIKQPKDFEIEQSTTDVNCKFEIKIEEDVELHYGFKYLVKGQLLCGKAYPVLKKEVRHSLTMKHGLALRKSFNLAKYLDSESSSNGGHFHDICRCIVTEVYQR